MRYIFTLTICLLAATSFAQQKNSLPFKELTGTWTMINKKGNLVAEVWVKKDDNSMAGKSYMVKGSDTMMLEKVDLIKEGDDIFYIPVAFGQNEEKPVRFKLTGINGTAYTFENPEHDFPKRIVYDFTGSDTLHAYVDDGTDKKRQHFNYKKQ